MQGNNAEPLIRIENLTKVYHADEVETHALSQVNLRIDNNEYVSVSGPSGCGIDAAGNHGAARLAVLRKMS